MTSTRHLTALVTALATLLAASAVFVGVPAVASAVTSVNEGSINTGDPDQTGRLSRTGYASTCGARKMYPGLGDDAAGPRNYVAYSFTNHSSAAECITVRLDPKTCVIANSSTNDELFSAAYSGSFNPASISANYLADMGDSPWLPNTPLSYSFTVPAGGSFVVVVHAVPVGGTCPGYTLTVSSPGALSRQQQPGTGTGAPGGPGSLLLAVSALSTDNPVFRVDPQGQVAQRQRRLPRGTRFRFLLSAAARVNFTIQRRTRGRRVGRRCRRQTRGNRNRRRCIRYVAVRRFARQGKAGQNVVPFSGRIRVRGRVRSLRPGRYRATLRAADAAGNRSAPARVAFRVVR